MAIDTENKRRSAQAYSTGGLPVPDGTITLADWATVTQIYAGLSFSSPPTHGIGAEFDQRFNLHHTLRPFN